MTVVASSGRVWRRNWLVYRRLWHRSLAFGFLQPVLFLTAMGLGIGAFLTRPPRCVRRRPVHRLARSGPDRSDGDADGDLRVDLPDHEQDHVGPELRGHSLDAARHPEHRARRAGMGGVPDRLARDGRLLFVLFLFGIPRSPMAFLAIPFAVLVGVAFAACLIAFTATQKNDVGFSAVFRFIINPLFLFSGTFFPITPFPSRSSASRGRRRSSTASSSSGGRSWTSSTRSRLRSTSRICL